jgi:hypothetical protein
MGGLPPTAVSWDISTMSRSDQLRVTRALIRNQLGTSARTDSAFPANLPLAATGTDRGAGAVTVAQRARRDTVVAGTPLPYARLEPVASASEGIAPADLPIASPVMAPLVSEVSRLTEEPESLASAYASPTDGMTVRTVIGQRHGVDLSRVPVNRSDAAASTARSARAEAFTSPAEVVIPASHGSLDTGPGQALLAHELTHVAQRARLGPSLPEENTPAGQVLEAEARTAEMTLATGLAVRPAPASPSPSSADPTRPGRLAAPPLSHTEPFPLAVPPSSVPNPEQLADSVFQRLSGFATSSPQLASPTWGGALPAIAAAPAPATAEAPIQRAEEETPAESYPPATTATYTRSSEPRKSPLERFGSEDYSNLVEQIYPLISYRIKGELREIRERSGLITDPYRRG